MFGTNDFSWLMQYNVVAYRDPITTTCSDMYHIKVPPEHSLKAEKLRFHLKNQCLLPKARNSQVPNEVTQVQILEPNQVTRSKSWNQTRLLDPKLGTKTCYSIRYEE